MLLIYFFGAIYYLENIFRILCMGKVLGPGIFYSLVFTIPLAILCYLICMTFKKNKRGLVATILIGLITTIFISQFIYFKIFRMFYSLYSVSNAGQIFEFWQIIVIKVRNNMLGVLLMLLPSIMMFYFRKNFKSSRLIKGRAIIYLGSGMVLCQILAVLSLGLGGKEVYSPYDLYFKHSYPVVAAEKMGLMTALRLEAKRSLFDWSPELSEVVQEITIVDNEAVKESPSTDRTTEVINKESDPNKTYNTLTIDFDQLIQQADSEEIANMHRYFKNAEASAKNEYTGKYKGYNLITITAEGFSPYAIREDLTPTLYKLAQEGYQFTNYYTPLWELSTSDGEYALCTGQIPKSGIWSMAASGENKMPFALGNQLKKIGYKTMAFHNHDYDYYDRHISHPNLGYTYEAKGLGLNISDTWPESDVEMMEQTVNKYVKDEPFHAYYMTVSGHMNYSFYENDMSKKNQQLVENLDLSETAKAYLACQIELDRSIKSLLDQLEAAGVLEHTLIAIMPDHYPYGLNNEYISELAGKTVDEEFGVYESTFLLYTPHMEPIVIDKPCSSLDVLPTLSNLMGIDYDSRLFVGRDIFSDSEPLVVLYSRHFITDKGYYNAMTKEFIEAPGAEVDEAYVRDMIDKVDTKFYYSEKVLDEDYYRYILSGLKQ